MFSGSVCLSEPLIHLITMILMMCADLLAFCVILGLQLISSFAGLLPVVSWVLVLNSLIINGIQFSDKQAATFNFL